MAELAFVETRELIEELKKRFDNCLIATHTDISESKGETIIWWSGSPIVAIGLAEHAKYRLIGASD